MFGFETQFQDRAEAGRLLGQQLARDHTGADVLVLALPRGGVPVGFEVAEALDAPLDLMVVRKLGVPGQEELAMGAIASGGVRVLNDDVVSALSISPQVLDAVTAVERAELARRERVYRGERPSPEVAGKTVLLVDDGLATGATMRAAVAAVRQLRPATVVVAVPVAPRDTLDLLRRAADEVVCPATPEPFLGVGMWYEDFSQTTDDEVRELLARAWRRRAATGRG